MIVANSVWVDYMDSRKRNWKPEDCQRFKKTNSEGCGFESGVIRRFLSRKLHLILLIMLFFLLLFQVCDRYCNITVCICTLDQTNENKFIGDDVIIEGTFQVSDTNALEVPVVPIRYSKPPCSRTSYISMDNFLSLDPNPNYNYIYRATCYGYHSNKLVGSSDFSPSFFSLSFFDSEIFINWATVAHFFAGNCKS